MKQAHYPTQVNNKSRVEWWTHLYTAAWRWCPRHVRSVSVRVVDWRFWKGNVHNFILLTNGRVSVPRSIIYSWPCTTKLTWYRQNNKTFLSIYTKQIVTRPKETNNTTKGKFSILPTFALETQLSITWIS